PDVYLASRCPATRQVGDGGRREAKSKLQVDGKAGGDGSRRLAESRWKGPIDLAAGKLQSSINRACFRCCRRGATSGEGRGSQMRRASGGIDAPPAGIAVLGRGGAAGLCS
ncbi:unnamed protein product, partial [Urochloa humidicola]